MYFLRFLELFKKLLKVTTKNHKITPEHRKWPKISTNSVKSSKAKKAGGRSPPQGLEVSPCRTLYLLVII